MSAETVPPTAVDVTEDTQPDWRESVRTAKAQLRAGESVTDIPSPTLILTHQAVITKFPLPESEHPGNS